MVIDKLVKHDGTKVELSNANVLVGPNNTGKTRSLQDIKSIMDSNDSTSFRSSVIFDEVVYEEPNSFDEAISGLSVREDKENSQYAISTIGRNRGTTIRSAKWQQWEENFEDQDPSDIVSALSSAKVSFLSAGSRLQTASGSNLQGNPDNPETIMESLYHDPSPISEIRSAFQRAFNMDLLFDYSRGSRVLFRVSESFSDIPERPDKLREYIERGNYESLSDQGDGYLSFVGVIMSILSSKGKVVLIDEPDAFLHPPQARILGNWIAEHAETAPGQVVIATHDSDLLFGILEQASNASVFRLNRPSKSTHYNRLSPDVTNKLSGDHLLSSQRVIRAVFHKGVVVCEGGKDRVVYQNVASTSMDETDILFVDALGWKIIKRVTNAMDEASIPTAAVVDLDVLNDRSGFKNLLLNLKGVSEYSQIDHIVEKRGEISDAVESDSSWKEVKRNGIEAIPQRVRGSTEEVIEEVKEYGLFMLRVGVLESWMDLSHINEPWPVAALQEISAGRCDRELEKFVTETCSYVNKDYQESS